SLWEVGGHVIGGRPDLLRPLVDGTHGRVELVAHLVPLRAQPVRALGRASALLLARHRAAEAHLIALDPEPAGGREDLLAREHLGGAGAEPRVDPRPLALDRRCPARRLLDRGEPLPARRALLRRGLDRALEAREPALPQPRPILRRCLLHPATAPAAAALGARGRLFLRHDLERALDID